ncbi:transforming growth factor-beta-induced protein ig-h3-like [Dermacentor variabilis]|uniref:transforming growth factor-beta-induced protein ig-h3-like n=1 Tax=Dermacentor variabilis TaxID=34621 RepID=UPI003F5BFE72
MKVLVAVVVFLVCLQHVSYCYPNLENIGNRTHLLRFFNSVPGVLGTYGTEYTIESLTGKLPLEWQNVTSRRSNLLEIAKKLNLTKLVEAVIKVGLGGLLNHEGPFTLFGPTNEAFEKVPGYCKNVPLKEVIKYHIALGSHKKNEFKNNLLLTSFLQQRQLRINVYPQTNSITAAGRNITSTDNVASNGVVHVLSDVICSLYKGSAAFELSRCKAYSILNELIKTADLYNALDGDGPFTLFAPVDKAFAKLSPDVIDHLKSNVTALKEVLLYHVVPDVWYSPGLVNGKLKTLQGQNLTISIDDGGVHINDATVTLADAAVRNGVVHSIDTVLIPKLLRFNRPFRVTIVTVA